MKWSHGFILGTGRSTNCVLCGLYKACHGGGGGGGGGGGVSGHVVLGLFLAE